MSPARTPTSDSERDVMLDMAVGAVRTVVHGARLCLPMSVLLERLLGRVLPEAGFSLRLGALHVRSMREGVQSIAFDPRGPEGVAGGFHAWVAASDGELVDPSIATTLAAEGYDVEPEHLFASVGRAFEWSGLRFVYEELSELHLLHLAEAEPYLEATLHAAMYGRPPGHRVLVCPLDVAWRGRQTAPTR